MNDIIGIVSGVVGLAGYGPYVRDILRYQTKPERTSWLIWTLEYAVLCGAQIDKGARAAAWLAGLQLAGVVVVYGLSLKYGVGEFDRRNQLLLACTVAALAAWLFTSSASIAICILITVETIGVFLTIVKAYKQPGSETLTMWLLLSAAGTLGNFAVPSGGDSVLHLYPTFLMCVGLAVPAASWLGARKSTPAIAAEDLDPAE